MIWKNKKCIIGSGLFTAGLLLATLFMYDENILMTIAGVLLIITGSGLFIIGLQDDNYQEDNINLYIGKQLFEKGLEAMVIGILVGSLSLIF